MKKLTMFILLVLICTLTHAQIRSAVTLPTIWHSGDTVLKSANRKFELLLQKDGNLVLYRVEDMEVFWFSRTAGKAVNELKFQDDGNFVLYGYNPTVLFNAGSGGKGGNKLILQDDGNLVIYAGTRAVWNTFALTRKGWIVTKKK